MNKRIVKAAMIAALACSWQAFGSTISMTLEPANGVVDGEPGATVGWGFDIVNDTSYALVIDDSYFCESGEDPVNGPDYSCGPALGASTYTDFIASNLNNPAQGVLYPGETIQAFDGVSNGVGAYAIDPAAAVGSTDSGTLVIVYDEYSPDFSTEIAANLELTAPVSVAVTPEPETAGPVAGALLMGALLVRTQLVLRRRASPVSLRTRRRREGQPST